MTSQASLMDLDIHELEELLARHPYSHHLRILWVQRLKSEDDVRLAEAIHDAAAHLPDRKRLKLHLDGLDGKVVTKDASRMKKGRSAVTEPDLERQYITEAVQVSIGLEAEESQEEATDQGTKEPKGIKEPTSFMDFIQGTGSDEVSASIESPQDLVERFLEEREPEPLPDFDATEAARKSLDDSEGPVSDTLARIYASQGNYQKAIDAYERLQLIYPDKSGYFAARIEKVLELKNKRKR